MASTQSGQASAKRLLARLSRIRREAKVLLVSRRVGWTLAAIVGGLAMVALLDYAIRLPSWVRYAGLFGAIAAAGWAFVRLVWPALRMHPSLTDLALRLEHGRPELKGRLASATDLARSGAFHARYEPLLDTLSRDALPDMMKRRPTLQAVGVCLLVIGAIVAFSAAQPGMAALGAARVLTPWSGVQWPSRTAIELAGSPRFHPLGEPCLLYTSDQQAVVDDGLGLHLRLGLGLDVGRHHLVFRIAPSFGLGLGLGLVDRIDHRSVFGLGFNL